MKIRNGFVSNSSSSSFIISTKNKNAKAIIEIDIGSLGNIYITNEEFEKWFIDFYGYPGSTIKSILEESPSLKYIYEEGINLINKGEIVVSLDIDYENEALVDLIKSSNDVTIIMED